ncbi:hypothetical protein CN068_16245 [Sinorhizobium meliloti]|nr:hypothetical protein CN068_16245 [Sinorhizobium meliloti]
MLVHDNLRRDAGAGRKSGPPYVRLQCASTATFAARSGRRHGTDIKCRQLKLDFFRKADIYGTSWPDAARKA